MSRECSRRWRLPRRWLRLGIRFHLGTGAIGTRRLYRLSSQDHRCTRISSLGRRSVVGLRKWPWDDRTCSIGLRHTKYRMKVDKAEVPRQCCRKRCHLDRNSQVLHRTASMNSRVCWNNRAGCISTPCGSDVCNCCRD